MGHYTFLNRGDWVPLHRPGLPVEVLLALA